MQVIGIDLEDVAAVLCSRVTILVESAGVERVVVKVADGEGYGVRGRWQETAASAHKVLSEGHLCVETEADAMTPASATEGPAAASASEF